MVPILALMISFAVFKPQASNWTECQITVCFGSGRLNCWAAPSLHLPGTASILPISAHTLSVKIRPSLLWATKALCTNLCLAMTLLEFLPHVCLPI